MAHDQLINPLVDMSRKSAVIFVAFGLLVSGVLDYVTGIEVRVYPLYFLPVGLAAWHLGRWGAVCSTLAASGIWVLSNRVAGMLYSANYIWILNAFSQAIAFGLVAALMYRSRFMLEVEKAHARTDSLTGLSNGRNFYHAVQVSAATCRRYQRPLTLAYIDLDNFKCVNDRYGHTQGDALLCEVADILREEMRVSDIVARIGGDEFVVCLPETSGVQAEPLLERLRASFARRLPIGDCKVSASIGALSWEVPPASIEVMVAAADKVMYDIKKNGKNRVEVVVA